MYFFFSFFFCIHSISLFDTQFRIASAPHTIYSYVDELLYWSGRRMRLDEFLQNDVAPNRLPSAWVTNTKFVFQNDDGGLAIFDTANDSVTILVTNHTMVSLHMSVSAFYFAILCKPKTF